MFFLFPFSHSQIKSSAYWILFVDTWWCSLLLMSSTTISAINNLANVIVGFCRGIFLHQPRVDLVRRLLQDGRLSSCMTIFFVCMRCLIDVFVLVKKKKIDGEGKLRKSIKENYQILAYFGKSMLYWCESFLQLALSMFSTYHNREIDYSSFSVLFLGDLHVSVVLPPDGLCLLLQIDMQTLPEVYNGTKDNINTNWLRLRICTRRQSIWKSKQGMKTCVIISISSWEDWKITAAAAYQCGPQRIINIYKHNQFSKQWAPIMLYKISGSITLEITIS